MPPPLCLLLLSHAALAALNGTHILSDTPSYLRTRGVVSRLFSEDIDVSSWTSELPPEWGVNVTAASGVCECSGRGICPSGSTDMMGCPTARRIMSTSWSVPKICLTLILTRLERKS